MRSELQQLHALAQGLGQRVHRPAVAGQQVAGPALADEPQVVPGGGQTLQRGQREHHVAHPVAQPHDQGSAGAADVCMLG